MGARACFPAPRVPLPRVPALGPAGTGCSQRGRWGRGRPQRQAPQEGPRPFLSVPPTAPAAVPAPRGSCNSQKQKPQRRNFPGGLEDCWAPTPFQGPPGVTAKGWETLGPGPAASSGARWLPCASPTVDGRSLGREGAHSPVSWGGIQRRPRGPPAPTPWPGSQTGRWGGCPGVGRAPAILTQLLGEDLLEGHLAPVLQVLLHDAADAGRQGGW